MAPCGDTKSYQANIYGTGPAFGIFPASSTGPALVATRSMYFPESRTRSGHLLQCKSKTDVLHSKKNHHMRAIKTPPI
ncbi:hypothetical protein TcasGA2_TC005407 [Tribolium castaneum]|uniref:Uncharacterized protein n=1 Tax=Tribolium castaneum TaxID=7070 RepID=D6WYZ9_TRICA|nr:hypothetical protein TcasGA2_TC005407 [Tribolium castaneum]